MLDACCEVDVAALLVPEDETELKKRKTKTTSVAMMSMVIPVEPRDFIRYMPIEYHALNERI